MTTIYELEYTIRDLINRPRKQAALLKSHSTWGMRCSSLDVIGDTECALAAYLAGIDSEEKGHDQLIEAGNLYLTLYGVLQVLFVQQDAVTYVHESLGLTKSPNPTVDAIRETGNDAVGHPILPDKEARRADCNGPRD